MSGRKIFVECKMIRLQFYFIFGLVILLTRVNSSSSVAVQVKSPGLFIYEGRFSKIDPFSEYEVLDSREYLNRCKAELHAIRVWVYICR